MLNMLHIHPIPILSDNYVWVVEHQHKPDVYIVDPGDAKPVKHWLRTHGKTPAGILVTHQHWDHVNGIAELVSDYTCPVYGPAIEQHPSVDHAIREGDELLLWGEIKANAIETPGHLPDHICWLITEGKVQHLLCADTLFSAGCGRIFRGTPKEFKASLDRIKALDHDTLLYPAHEYTLANLKFAHHVEPDNTAVIEEIHRVTRLRDENLPSLPSSVGRERLINPFLRTGEATIAASCSKHAGTNLDGELAVFTELRAWKDVY